MVYSFKDIYGEVPSNQMTTNEQTIPEQDEERRYLDGETATNENGMKSIVPKGKIWGAFLLLVGVMFLLHLID